MNALPVILIFDVGKTNKKILLFDEQYRLVHEETVHMEEIKDEDGFPCEDIHSLTEWITASFTKIINHNKYDVRAVNFSGYGASFVFVDEQLKPILPLYNYLKPYPPKLQKHFYETYGGEQEFSKISASPVLGSLNSGMQILRIKHEKPEMFKKIAYALHLPQYLSAILTQHPSSEITSIGCHTNLWNFPGNRYHTWVTQEGIEKTFPPLTKSDTSIEKQINDKHICIGIGLHDSSAALIPYLINFTEPFILLSTGTWCISLNPFNHIPLSQEELQQDCLCYLSHHGTPVKASRLFAGHDHEIYVRQIAEHFNLPVEHFTTLELPANRLNALKMRVAKEIKDAKVTSLDSAFAKKSLGTFASADEAYEELLSDIVLRQFLSTSLVKKGNEVKRIFVDGGFSKNSIYMNLMTAAFPDVEVYAASVAQASALGAALILHSQWSKTSLPSDLIALRLYSGTTALQ